MGDFARKIGGAGVALAAAMLLGAPANAQMADISGPRQVPAGCANFHQAASGTWTADDPVLVNGRVIVGTGVVIGPNEQVDGFKIGEWLSLHCPGYAQQYNGPFAGHCGGWAGRCEDGRLIGMP